MIITCEQCQTRFELDPAKLPARGARVRCSRCKSVFDVPAPGASADEAIHDAAAAAVESAAPEPTHDPVEPAAGPGPLQGASALSAAPDESGPEEDTKVVGAEEQDRFGDTMSRAAFDFLSPSSETTDDESWEFNEDPPSSPPAEALDRGDLAMPEGREESAGAGLREPDRSAADATPTDDDDPFASPDSLDLGGDDGPAPEAPGPAGPDRARASSIDAAAELASLERELSGLEEPAPITPRASRREQPARAAPADGLEEPVPPAASGLEQPVPAAPAASGLEDAPREFDVEADDPPAPASEPIAAEASLSDANASAAPASDTIVSDVPDSETTGFDFGDDDEPESVSATTDAADFSDLFDDLEANDLEPRAAEDASAVGPVPAVGSQEAQPASTPLAEAREAPPARRRMPRLAGSSWLSGFASSAASALVYASLAVGLAGALRAAGPVVAIESTPRVQASGVGIAAVEGRRVVNAHAAPLLVVSGELQQAVSRGERGLRVKLLGPGGEPIESAWAGPVLTETQIREARPAALVDHLREGASFLAVEPGRFHAVFVSPPDGVVGFAFDAAPLPVTRPIPPQTPAVEPASTAEPAAS